MKKSAVNVKFNKTVDELIDIVESSRRSENLLDYCDSDGEGWGPALGLAARAGKEYNEKIPDLIQFLEGLKR